MPANSKNHFSVDVLWALERVSAPSLSPDGSQAVCAVTRYVGDAGRPVTRLWLLSTLGGASRVLTTCGEMDRQAAWSPKGDWIAFIGKRANAGAMDETPQLYVMAPDGGEARRVGYIAAGVEAFKWSPDGRHLIALAWVWPALRGMKAQNQRHAEFAKRHESGYATSEGFYRYWDHNLPEGRVVHLLHVSIATGAVRDLLDGSRFELPRADPSSEMFDISPDGQRIVFMTDPAAEKNASHRHALAMLTVATRKIALWLDDPRWDFASPRFSPSGHHLAFLATPRTPKHTHFARLAIANANRTWNTFDAEGDVDVEGPLRWSASGDAVYFAAELRARRHVWRQRRHVDAARELVWHGGWVQGFDLARTPGADVLAIASESILHPPRVYAATLGCSGGTSPTVKARRIESFNDAVLGKVALGRIEEVHFTGALGDTVQMWLVFPPNFSPKRKHAVLHVIHGGPYAALGDNFSWRWNPHVLSSQGHVVAMVNYHGSSGFGHDFRDSIMGRMGQLELIDIEAATDWLRKQPWVDHARIDAAGGSYGGFLVAWMNGHVNPPRYRSYICHAGVFDRAATWSADSYTQRHRDLHATYWDNPAKVAAQSPISFAANMNTPTFITHGALDYRVPDHNGLAYYNTLKARGVSARLLWFPDEHHWVLKAANSKQWYAEVLAWLQQAHGRVGLAKPRRKGIKP
jgi:dipeptidyl aminopeptidase/acylaminoacyl peptidase